MGYKSNFIIILFLLGFGVSCGHDGIAPSSTFHLTPEEIIIAAEKANRGDPDSAFTVYLHFNFLPPRYGKIAEQNRKKMAVQWLEQAANLGHPVAQHNFGYHLLRDQDKSNDYQGIEMMKRAERAGIGPQKQVQPSVSQDE